MTQTIDVHRIFAEYFRGCEALAYAISQRLAQGHICLDIDEYAGSGELTEGNPFFTDRGAFIKLSQEGTFVTQDEDAVKPFVLKHGKAYLQRYFHYETRIIENLKRLGNNFRIITGGPGTGKTYGVSGELIKIFGKNPDITVALTAPTGKAAARMNESIRVFISEKKNEVSDAAREKLNMLKAQTLHRMLGTKPDSVFFRYNAENRLPYDVIIADECSMIDGAMMAKLLDAVNDDTKLFLLGDKDQLASVEAGSVFGDLCRLQNTSLLAGKVDEKKESWRFDPDKGIGKFSKEVIRGTLGSLSDFDHDDQITIDTGFSESLFRQQALMYREYIKEKDIQLALAKLNLVRFLCVIRENENSVADTNIRIEKILKKETNDFALFNPTRGFYHNQPVIVTKNDYSLNVFNGDVGLIRRDGDILYAYFEDSEQGIKRIQAGYLNHYDTVFAMTIHKSQGSEFDHVVVLLPEKQGEKLLTRELLYTAVTRGKLFALVQSSEENLRKCVECEVARSSGLFNRLN